MCGIAGGIALIGEPRIEAGLVQKMCKTIEHRGPDGFGYVSSPHNQISTTLPEHTIIENNRPFQLGHRRLSIIDLSTAANQPMIDKSQRYAIVFNGEIYNHAELRVELQAKGVAFTTSHSDTEVLLNGLIHEGKEFLQKLNGMFAFCFADLSKDYFLFARDRLGIKPFYYSIINDAFYFGSEVRALRAVVDFDTTINHEALFDFMVFSSVKAPKTIFKQTFKLSPGNLIEINQGVLSDQTPYWDLKNIIKRESSFKQEKEELLNQFDRAAQRRMIADVEVGVLLSGGVDSTANLGMLTRHSNQPISAFSIGFENTSEYSNEFEYARLAANHFNADYHETKLTYDDYLQDLLNQMSHQDLPLSDAASTPIFRMAELARKKGIKVLLGGEGSDEILIGYNYWSHASRYQKLLKGSKGKAKLFSYLHELPKVKNRRMVYKTWYDKTKQGYTHFTGGAEIRSIELARSMLSPDVQKELKDYNPLDQIQAVYTDFMSSGDFDYFDWMTYLDLSHRLPEMLLARLDRMMMAASVEGRVPFLDHNLVEFCFSMPNEFKFKGGIEKYILKKSFEGIIPDQILYRPKIGFIVPLNNIILRQADQLNRRLNMVNAEFNLFAPEITLANSSDGLQNYNLVNFSIWAEGLINSSH